MSLKIENCLPFRSEKKLRVTENKEEKKEDPRSQRLRQNHTAKLAHFYLRR